MNGEIVRSRHNKTHDLHQLCSIPYHVGARSTLVRVPISFFIRWTHSNNYISLVVRSLSRSVSHAHAVSRSLLSLTLGSRSARASLTLSLLTLCSRSLTLSPARSRPPANPPSRSYRTLCLISHMRRIPPSSSLMLSSRDSRPHAASPALVLSDVLSASHALFSFQLSRPTLVVSQLKFSQKSSNAHLILLRGRIE